MVSCDMCGKITDELCVAMIEGTRLTVCRKCSSYGKIISNRPPLSRQDYISNKKEIASKHPQRELIQAVKEDYSVVIRNKRESMGLKQKELAVKLAEKESLIQKIETAQIVPSLSLARKLEKHLGIELIEQKEVEQLNIKAKPDELTIGDMIKLK
ncbi:MAG: multiprotein bridging factor aMBF1 [archaeon]